MFDRIFDFIASVWEWLIPWVVIDAYEQGVVLRLGKFNRIVNPGFNLIWPLGFEAVKYETVVRQTVYLDPQSLTTSDGKSITVAAIVIFKIADIRKFLLDIDDGEDDMSNMIYGIISDWVQYKNWSEIVSKDFDANITIAAKEQCNEYCGIEIIGIKWSDKATARNIRLWND